MAINKKLIHFNNFSNFNSKKLSANIENTKYTIGIDGSVQEGNPEILYQSIVYIKDTQQQWTHGQLYESNINVDYIINNFVDKSTNQSISGAKTFTNHVNLNNKSRIRSNIDPGEFKVTRTDSDKGFIVRVNKDSQDSILPLEILTTNGSASYQYNFPKTSGNIALGVKKAGQILETNLNDGLIDLGDNCLRVTYSNLKSLRDNGNLIPGQKYRITDYKATTQGLSGISVADHSFDIIVEALTQNTLSESAKAAKSDNTLGTKQQDLFSWDMNPGNWTKTTNAEIQQLTDATIYYQQGTRDVNQAGVIKVIFTPIVEDPETNDICIGADLVKNGSVVSKDYHIGRINYNPYQADNNVYYLPVSGPGSYVIRYYVAGSSSNFETNLRITAEAYDSVGYFSNCNLNAWDIKYCLDCDTNRFQWVNINPYETKGVIYYMKDDHENEAPYDFKNILFDGHYTFSYITSSGEIQDASVQLTNCYANKINGCYTTSNVQKLNEIVFKIVNSASICGYNEFNGNCENITFGDNCCSNKFGSYCKNNSFGDSCSYNTFADYCANNSFINFCQSNNFGVYCQNNSFDSYIIRVTFGKQCINNKFTNNSLGDNLLEACRMIKFGDQCNGVNLYTTLGPSYSSGKWMQNITLSNALSGNIEITELNNDRNLFITKDSNSSIVKYFESDFINKQDTITDLEVIRQGAAKGATALQSYTEQYKGTVTSITINGSSKSPSNGIIDLGTVITAHQDISGKQDTLVSGTNIKTINGESILGNGNINIENVQLGYSTLETIALYDIVYETNGEIKSIGKDNWNSNLGTLVGLVVIPKDCSPDGKARMISLQNTSLQDQYRFSNKPDLQVTMQYMQVPVTDNEGSTSIGSNAYGYLPSDRFTNEQSYVDEYAKYSENQYLIPSPYCTNLGANYFNPDYAQLVFSNFNGLESSETLLSYTPVSKCLNHYNNGFSWYLPSIGELGFLMSRFQELNNILQKLNKPLLKDGAYCSSSTISFDRFMGLNTIYGEVISMSHYDQCFIIPFTIL